MPDQQPPFYVPPVGPRDAALIAGFLLHFRWAVLEALYSMSDPSMEKLPEWSDPLRQYWVDAERYSRYLLWAIGYPVAKNDTWPGFEYRDNAPTGLSGLPPP